MCCLCRFLFFRILLLGLELSPQIGHRNEVWSFDISPDQRYLVSGSTDHDLRVWALRVPTSTTADAPTADTTDEAARKARKTSSDASPASASSSIDQTLPPQHAVAFASAAPTDAAALHGTLRRACTTQRVAQIRFNHGGSLLAVASADKMLEVFTVRSADEVKRKVQRRLKRARERKERRERRRAQQANAADDSPDEEDADGDDADNVSTTPTPADEFGAMLPLRCANKLRAFDFSPQGWGAAKKSAAAAAASSSSSSSSSSGSLDRLLLTMQNNEVLVYDLDSSKEDPFVRALELDQLGHRSGVRCCALSSDDGVLMTASAEHVKVWNTRSRACVRTLESGYALCGAFAPGDRHVLIGTKAGAVELYDIAAAECTQSVVAHEGAVWTLDMRPDQRGFVTGGAGREVKFWEFELVPVDAAALSSTSGGGNAANAGAKRLAIVHTRTLQLTDDVLAVKHSPDGKFLAVSLLDSTIRIFYEDSLKFFLSLYGHKLPALSIDISSDSTLLISASADKNVKIWGLDFGDCHKSLFAHQDSVMQVRFVRDTHYFFSVGKDRLLKYWDADKFEQILSLAAHQAEVWALAVSSLGDFVVTAGNDRSIRMWHQTDEQVFVDEEKENALEALFEQGLEREAATAGGAHGQPGAADGAGLAAAAESARATRASLETLKAGERLIDCIDLACAERARMDEFARMMAQYDEAVRRYELQQAESKTKGAATKSVFGLPVQAAAPPTKPAPAPANPLMLGKTADRFMLHMLKTVRSTDLEEALMVLPFEHVIKLLGFLDVFIQRGWDIELSVRCLLFILRIHQAQIVANQALLERVHSLREFTRARLRQQKDEFGFNLAAMRFMQQSVESDASAFFFEDTNGGAAAASSSAARS